MWAIEHNKGVPPTEDEKHRITEVIDTLPEPSAATTRPRTAAPRPAAVARTAATPVHTPRSLSRAAVGIDWSSLRRRADEVSEHDIERYTVGPDPSLGYRLISNSELRTFTECPRKWWLAYYRKLKLRQESPLGPLAVGDRIHRALRWYYVPKHITAVDPRETIEKIIVSDWERVTRHYDEGDPQLAQLRTAFVKESDLERIMLEGYVEWLRDTGIDEELEVLGSECYREVEFEVESDVPVKLIGKLDTRLRRRSDGIILFMDHKTVANMTSPRATLHLDTQMLHYLIIETLALPEGERCAGALYNMLRKTLRTNRATPPFYDRVEVRHNKHAVASHQKRLRLIIQQILDVEAELDNGVNFKDVIFHNPTQDCAWKCNFFAVCPMFDDNSRVEAMLSQYYTNHDVFEYYRDDRYEETND
jgi:hypothetical protein